MRFSIASLFLLALVPACGSSVVTPPGHGGGGIGGAGGSAVGGSVGGSTSCTSSTTGCGLGTCGTINDGCGNALDCGGCPPGQACEGGTCVCAPKTCAELGHQCGTADDGCGNTIDCGTCPPSTVCAAGQPNLCISYDVPKTCAELGYECGMASDGLGGVLDCGTCPIGQTCGGGGVPNMCGSGGCTCLFGVTCGPQPNCGGLDCGACPAGESCQNGQCVCTPKTCAELGAECGTVNDGCGGVLQCGLGCPSGQTCGANGKPNTCGVGTCTQKNCWDNQSDCGHSSDGCNGVLNCGQCGPNQACDTIGHPGQCFNICGPGACCPVTCLLQGMQCGLASDGCGGLLQCGDCPAGQACGAVKYGVCG